MTEAESQIAAPKPRRRWFWPTPDRLVAALLAIEGLLWLSERFGWLPWHKGYAVLTTVACVIVAMVLMLVWFGVALVFRRRFQFSIRSLLVLVVVVAVPCSWLAVEINKARQQREAVEAIVVAGGSVNYEFLPEPETQAVARGARGLESFLMTADYMPGPAWLYNLLGIDFFYHVQEVYIGMVYPVGSLGRQTTEPAYGLGSNDLLVHVDIFSHMRRLEASGPRITDIGVTHVAALSTLKSLSLLHTETTDASLKRLYELRNLQDLDLRGTNVTDAGVKKLQQALPTCKIEWKPPTKDERHSPAAPDQLR